MWEAVVYLQNGGSITSRGELYTEQDAWVEAERLASLAKEKVAFTAVYRLVNI
jgi:hypothetical protein